MATAVYMGMQGRLFEWFKNEGDEVSRDDVVARWRAWTGSPPLTCTPANPGCCASVW